MSFVWHPTIMELLCKATEQYAWISKSVYDPKQMSGKFHIALFSDLNMHSINYYQLFSSHIQCVFFLSFFL